MGATGSAYQIAEAYAFRKEADKAFEWLERAFAQRDAGLTFMRADPLLEPIRGDRRYGDFLKRMNLPT